MLLKSHLVIGVLFVALNSFASKSGGCGKLRWPVKTGSDLDIAQVNLSTVTPIQVSDLIAIVAPKNLPQSNRVKPVETTLYKLQTTIVEANKTNDSDYHILIKDALGNSMVTEVPDPACVSDSSPVKKLIIQVRNEVEKNINFNGSTKNLNIPVEMIGIGFFDTPHAQGSAENGVEIHPILNISFKANINNQQTPTSTNSIPEYDQVTENIFRGGRPVRSDLDWLAQNKIKTIINLEDNSSAVSSEQDYLKKIGVKFISFPMSATQQPNDTQINSVLNALQDPTNFPIFIHCHHGQDRTGMLIGLYRVFVQTWKSDQAYQEMLGHGFHPVLKKLDNYFKIKTKGL